MVEHVAIRDAEMILEWRTQVLKVSANLVLEFHADLTVGVASAEDELKTAVRQANELKAGRAASERTISETHRAWLDLVTQAQRRRIVNGIARALPSVATRVE